MIINLKIRRINQHIHIYNKKKKKKRERRDRDRKRSSWPHDQGIFFLSFYLKIKILEIVFSSIS